MTTNRTISRLVAAAGAALVLAPAALGEGLLSSMLAYGGHGLDHGAASCLHCNLLAASANPIDAATGRDARNFARSPEVDFRHMTLELTINDMSVPVIQARQTLTVVAPHREVSTLTLDARHLRIESVAAEGRKAVFAHDNDRLTITFDPPLEPNRPTDVVTRYEIRDPERGLYWTLASDAWPGRPPQIHTQGQPETNSSWFPCHDFPNEKLTTELIVTAPAGYEVLSNGRLAEKESTLGEKTNLDGGTELEPFDRWRWVQDKPHVNYLVTLVVGKFDVVDLGSPALPMPVYAPIGRGNDVRGTYGRTPAMVRHFGELLGEQYPWDKYAQAVVWNFIAGGMENTSATTMYDTAIHTAAALEDFDLDGLISHELAHQWFGDLMTCQTWEHLWLNEGWATYMTQLWYERRDGRPAYEAAVRGLFDGVIAGDTGSLPETPGMASRVYTDPWESFRRSANPYGKGASILAMLRAKLGDDAFFKGVALYIDRHKHTNVVTSDFRRALEDASGESLEQFFAQWVFRPNVPRVTIDASWDENADTLTLDASQTQTINGHNPAFEFDLPVWALESAEPRQWVKGTLSFRGKKASLKLGLHGAPAAIAFDPELTVISDVTCDHPAAASGTLATQGATLAARMQGIRGLGRAKGPSNEDLAALSALVTDGGTPTPLRVEAAKALGALKDAATLGSLATATLDRWEVREAVLDAVAAVSGPDQASPISRERGYKVLLRAWERDPSTKVRAAAIRGLAAIRADLDTIVAAAKVDSQDDEIRRAAMQALVSLDVAAGLREVIEVTKPGNLSRTRADAIGHVVKLASHDREAAFEAVSACLDDREQRARLAAGQALADLKDPRGVALLTTRLAKVREASERRMIERWIASLGGQ
jgi:aminopeptidase N